MRHGDDGVPDESLFQEQFECDEHEQRAGERHRQSQRQRDRAIVQRRGDVGRLDVPEIDAEKHDQHHFGEEHQAEEERQSTHRVVAVPLEEVVIDAIEQRPGAIEHRCQ